MRSPRRSALAIAMASIFPLAHAAEPAAAPAAPPAASSPAPAATAPARLDAIQVTGKRLDAARNQLSPDTGSTVYRFGEKDIAALPMGEATPLNQVLLQAPGVVQDSYGQVHVRGDHGNLQYRINGVVIPESISGFGQAIDTRLASQINVITGALPAQYGYRTAGVVDIVAKSRAEGTGGSIGLVGGSRGHREGGIDLGFGNGSWSGFVAGSWLRNDIGIENPTADRNAVHDNTTQAKGFAYLSKLIDAESRVSVMLGSSDNRFQIPNVPGQAPHFTLAGSPAVDSRNLDARQTEKTDFQVLSYQATGERVDYQVSLTRRFSHVGYQPDAVGDLVFNGIAANIARANTSLGAQADLAWRLAPDHTVRMGLVAQRERFGVDNTASVFPADAGGGQTSDVPLAIVDDTRLRGHLYGAYLQDEWQITPALVLNYGARYDRVDTVTKEAQLSPRVGLVYDLGKETRVHAGYARYFTPPPTEKIDTTSIAKFAGTTNALPSDANTAVASERSHYFDAGISHQLTPSVTIGVDAYYRVVRNLQDEGQFGKALIYSAFNYGQGRIGGIEFSTTYREKNVTAYANVSLSRARARTVATGQFNFDDAELSYIASHWVHLDHEQTLSGSAGAAYQWGATRLSTDLVYGSGLRRGFANTEHLPSYVQVNFGLARSFDLGPLGTVDGRLTAINLFDRSYAIRDGSGIGVGAPQYGPRRGFFVGMTKNF